MGRKKAEEREVQRRELEQQIKAHTQEMAWEINWRLLCGKKTGTSTEEAQTLWKLLYLVGQEKLWTELCMAGQTLWVEEVELTAISYPKEHLGFAANLKRIFDKFFTYISRLFKKKNKKGKKYPNFIR